MLAFGLMELLLRRGETAKSVRPGALDRGTTLTIVVAYALAVASVSTSLLPVFALPPGAGWVGVGVAAVGIAVRVWAMRVLGRFYTRTLVTTGDQRVVEEGPYKLVRHPGYLGSLLLWLGASVASMNLYAVAAVTVLLAVAYAYRIKVEETMLMGALGDAYAAYAKRTWRLVPYVF